MVPFKERTENQGCQIFCPDPKIFVRSEPFKMVITSYLGGQVDPMLEVHTEQKVEFPLTEDFFITGYIVVKPLYLYWH
jgi:hypothetical protein